MPCWRSRVLLGGTAHHSGGRDWIGINSEGRLAAPDNRTSETERLSGMCAHVFSTGRTGSCVPNRHVLIQISLAGNGKWGANVDDG
jgi:hypothetical protein